MNPAWPTLSTSSSQSVTLFEYFSCYTQTSTPSVTAWLHISLTLAVLYANIILFRLLPVTLFLPHTTPPSFSRWPVFLLSGNITLSAPSRPQTYIHCMQHIVCESETRTPPVCLCVGGYMAAFRCAVFTGVWVCVCRSRCYSLWHVWSEPGVECVIPGGNHGFYLEKSMKWSSLRHEPQRWVESF